MITEQYCAQWLTAAYALYVVWTTTQTNRACNCFHGALHNNSRGAHSQASQWFSERNEADQPRRHETKNVLQWLRFCMRFTMRHVFILPNEWYNVYFYWSGIHWVPQDSTIPRIIPFYIVGLEHEPPYPVRNQRRLCWCVCRWLCLHVIVIQCQFDGSVHVSVHKE